MTDRSDRDEPTGPRLHREPFHDHCDEHFHYADAAREKSRNLLLHLIPYSELLLVTGEQGSGKTAFVQHLLAGAGESWRVLALQGSPAVDDSALLEALDREFSVRAGGEDQGLAGRLQRLRRNLDALRRGALLPLLVIDDAHLLPRPALAFLAELISLSEEKERLIGVVLVGEREALREGLGAPECAGLEARIRHAVDLAPLDEAGTAAYIGHRLAAAGADPTRAFTPAVVKYIHTASQGMPGRINELARVVFERQRPQGDESTATPAASGVLLRYGAAALLLSLGAVALIYRDDLGLTRDTGERVADAAPPAPRATEAIAAIAPLLPEPVPEPIPEPIPEPPAVEDIAPDEPAMAESLEETPPRIGEADDEQGAADVAMPMPMPEAPESVVAPVPAEPSPAPPRREAWLLEQAPSVYTLQLFASDEARILSFIEEHRLQDQAAVFRARGGDRPLFAVTYGAYATREEAARSASEGAVKDIRGIQPWPRPLGDIQAAIGAVAAEAPSPEIGPKSDSSQ